MPSNLAIKLRSPVWPGSPFLPWCNRRLARRRCFVSSQQVFCWIHPRGCRRAWLCQLLVLSGAGIGTMAPGPLPAGTLVAVEFLMPGGKLSQPLRALVTRTSPRPADRCWIRCAFQRDQNYDDVITSVEMAHLAADR
jgi:hypothetical protein